MKKIFTLVLLSYTQILFSPYETTPNTLKVSRQEDSPDDFSGFSLFNHPIVKRTDELLAKPVTRATTKQIFLAMTENITPENSCSKKLTVPQQFLFHALIEKLLTNCDDIISNPIYQLTKPSTIMPSQKELKTFQELSTNKTLHDFAKLYRLVNKMSSERTARTGCFNAPPDFNIIAYMTTSEYDCFFESNQPQTQQPLPFRSYRIDFSLKNILCHLAQFIEVLKPDQANNR